MKLVNEFIQDTLLMPHLTSIEPIIFCGGFVVRNRNSRRTYRSRDTMAWVPVWEAVWGHQGGFELGWVYVGFFVGEAV